MSRRALVARATRTQTGYLLQFLNLFSSPLIFHSVTISRELEPEQVCQFCGNGQCGRIAATRKQSSQVSLSVSVSVSLCLALSLALSLSLSLSDSL